MHRQVTDTENLQKLRRPEGSTDQTSCSARTSAIAHESDIFVVVISVQEAMKLIIYISVQRSIHAQSKQDIIVVVAAYYAALRGW